MGRTNAVERVLVDLAFRLLLTGDGRRTPRPRDAQHPVGAQQALRPIHQPGHPQERGPERGVRRRRGMQAGQVGVGRPPGTAPGAEGTRPRPSMVRRASASVAASVMPCP